MCKNEFLGVGYDYQDDYLSKIRQVTPNDIQRVVSDYFDTENIVIATAGKKPNWYYLIVSFNLSNSELTMSSRPPLEIR